jgi:hypothetical protein
MQAPSRSQGTVPFYCLNKVAASDVLDLLGYFDQPNVVLPVGGQEMCNSWLLIAARRVPVPAYLYSTTFITLRTTL